MPDDAKITVSEDIQAKSLTTKPSVQTSQNIVSGALTGVTVGAIFHPWDRALYLAMANKRQFFYDRLAGRVIRENFTAPYHGFAQTLASRTLSNGLYFVLQKELSHSLYPYLRYRLELPQWQSQLGLGLSIGALSGVAMNGLYAIKYQTWNTKGSSFLSNAYKMWSSGGVLPFTKGMSATVSRDALFGTLYEGVRHLIPPQKENGSLSLLPNPGDAVAAGIATVASSPLNYIRSHQYASSPNQKSPAMLKILGDLWKESKAMPLTTPRFRFFQQAFQIGPGTARVAASMAIGQKLYDLTLKTISDDYSEKPTPIPK